MTTKLCESGILPLDFLHTDCDTVATVQATHKGERLILCAACSEAHAALLDAGSVRTLDVEEMAPPSPDLAAAAPALLELLYALNAQIHGAELASDYPHRLLVAVDKTLERFGRPWNPEEEVQVMPRAEVDTDPDRGLPPWAFILFDATGIQLLDGAESVKMAVGDATAGDLFDDPPAPGLWYWTGTIGWEPGGYECPEDGEPILTASTWTPMTVRNLLDGERPEGAEDPVTVEATPTADEVRAELAFAAAHALDDLAVEQDAEAKRLALCLHNLEPYVPLCFDRLRDVARAALMRLFGDFEIDKAHETAANEQIGRLDEGPVTSDDLRRWRDGWRDYARSIVRRNRSRVKE